MKQDEKSHTSFSKTKTLTAATATVSVSPDMTKTSCTLCPQNGRHGKAVGRVSYIKVHWVLHEDGVRRATMPKKDGAPPALGTTFCKECAGTVTLPAGYCIRPRYAAYCQTCDTKHAGVECKRASYHNEEMGWHYCGKCAKLPGAEQTEAAFLKPCVGNPGAPPCAARISVRETERTLCADCTAAAEEPAVGAAPPPDSMFATLPEIITAATGFAPHTGPGGPPANTFTSVYGRVESHGASASRGIWRDVSKFVLTCPQHTVVVLAEEGSPTGKVGAFNELVRCLEIAKECASFNPTTSGTFFIRLNVFPFMKGSEVIGTDGPTGVGLDARLEKLKAELAHAISNEAAAELAKEAAERAASGAAPRGPDAGMIVRFLFHDQDEEEVALEERTLQEAAAWGREAALHGGW